MIICGYLGVTQYMRANEIFIWITWIWESLSVDEGADSCGELAELQPAGREDNHQHWYVMSAAPQNEACSFFLSNSNSNDIKTLI